MHRRPLILGIDSKAFSASQRSGAEMLVAYGRNSGNALFSEALYAAIGNATRGTYAPTPAQLAEHDTIVIAAANWLNEWSDFAWLANHIERTQATPVIVGLGAQAGLDRTIPKLPAGTLRLIKLLSERSVSISARGAFTCEVLAHYGVKNVALTGCPSLLLCGSAAPSFAPAVGVAWSQVAMHASRNWFNQIDAFQAFLYRQAMAHDAMLVLQAEAECLELDDSASAEDSAETTKALPAIYGSDAASVRAYLKRQGRIFWSLEAWKSALRQKRFVVGSRVHGSIMGLIAGVPALLIAHDSRTAEMAEAMRLPVIQQSQIDQTRSLPIAELAARCDVGAFQRGYESYLRNFLGFFGANKVPVNEAHFAKALTPAI